MKLVQMIFFSLWDKADTSFPSGIYTDSSTNTVVSSIEQLQLKNVGHLADFDGFFWNFPELEEPLSSP